MFSEQMWAHCNTGDLHDTSAHTITSQKQADQTFENHRASCYNVSSECCCCCCCCTGRAALYCCCMAFRYRFAGLYYRTVAVCSAYPHPVISAACTLGIREYSCIPTLCALGAREDSVIPASGTRAVPSGLPSTQSFQLLVPRGLARTQSFQLLAP